MEKYFITQITKTTDVDSYAIATTVKDTLNEAKSLYFQILASVYATANMEHAIVKIENAFGSTMFMDTIIPSLPESEG